MKPSRLIYVLLYLLVFGLSLSEASTGTSKRTIELRITDHKPGIADFKELNVSLASISIHPANAPRGDGWIELSGKTALIDIVPLKDGIYMTLGTVEIPAQRFDAVRIKFSELKSELLNGNDVSVTWRDTTIAHDIDMQKHMHLSLLVDLYAEDQTEHPSGSYVVKVREIRLDE